MYSNIDVKVTRRARDYAGDRWKEGVKGDIKEMSDKTVIRNTTEQELDSIVNNMNSTLSTSGVFYDKKLQPNDKFQGDYEIVFRKCFNKY